MKINSNILSPQTRLVILDLDGTLYPKKGLALKMVCASPFDVRRMLAERKTRKLMRGTWYGDEEMFYHAYFKTMSQYCSQSPKQLRQWYFERYIPLMVEMIKRYHKPSQWVESFVSECKDNGTKVVVLSDYEHTHEKLSALGLDHIAFDWVVSAPELGGLKPASQLMTKLTEHMGVMCNQCLVIGDRIDTDGQLAHNAGAAFYQV